MERSKLRYGVYWQGALKLTQGRRVCLYGSVRVEPQTMPDCDSTVCAELRRGRKKFGTAHRKRQMKVRIRIQRRKDRLREKKIWKKEITDKVFPMLNQTSRHDGEGRSRDVTPRILSFDTGVQVNVQLHDPPLQRWGPIPWLQSGQGRGEWAPRLCKQQKNICLCLESNGK